MMEALRVLATKFRTKATYQYVLAIAFGIVYGFILNSARAGHSVTTILTIPGPLFLRALQCAVLPMMYVICSIGEFLFLRLHKPFMWYVAP